MASAVKIAALLLLLLLAPAALAAPAVPVDPADPRQAVIRTHWNELNALLNPGEQAAWLALAWETDLWKARQRAAREGKPIFLWEMDGHPLGCT